MTRTLPDDGVSLLIRTDFSDDAGWRAAVDAASRVWDLGNGESAVAALSVVDDAAFEGLTSAELSHVIGGPPPHYVFVADAETIADPEHSILAVDTSGSSADYPTFRVHPSQMPTVENNLSLANVDFEDFSSAVGADGVFRGLEPPTTNRALSKADLLDAIDRSTVSAEAIAEYRAALEKWGRSYVDGIYTPDARTARDYLAERRHEYAVSSWVIGLDETIEALGQGGPIFGMTLIPSMKEGRPTGYLAAYVDANTLVPIAVRAWGVPLPRRAP